MKLRDSVVIVTGASGGIGAATARELAQHGAIVVLAARRADQIAAIKAEIERAGGRALAVQTDLTQTDQIEQLVQRTIAAYGRIDALVNNAGLSPGKTIGEIEDDQIKQVIEVNVIGPLRTTKAVVPHMRRQGGGVIVNIGSVAGEVATNSTYAASKFGVRGFTDGARRELRRDGIALVLIEPGFIRTNMTAGAKIPMPGPDLIARAVRSAIERPRRTLIVPWWYRPLVIIAKLAPWLADLILGSTAYQSSYRKRKQVAEQTYKQS